MYHVYHNTEDLRGEPHTVAIRGEDDVHVTEEVFKRPLFLQPTYRYLELMSSLGWLSSCYLSFPHLHIRLVLGNEGLELLLRVLARLIGCLLVLSDITVSPCQSKGLPRKPSLMPLSAFFG